MQLIYLGDLGSIAGVPTTLRTSPAVSIRTDVRLHAEKPLVSFPGLMHLGITLAILVLGRTRRMDDGRVHDGAMTQHQSVLTRVAVDDLEQRRDHAMPLKRQRKLRIVVSSGIWSRCNQITSEDLEALNITDAAVATAVGALTQGKGVVGSVGVSMGGAYIGSQVKETDAGSAVVGAGVGTVVGIGAGKFLGNKVSTVVPEQAAGALGAVAGAVTSEFVSDTGEAILNSEKNR